MGDRYFGKPKSLGDRLMARRGKPPPEIIAWGLGELARIGHNNGPPLDDDSPGYIWRRYRWTKAHAQVWKTPPLSVLKFRMKRADAAGMTYREYMLTLLDTGRFAQAKDRDVARVEALGRVRAAFADVLARVAPLAPRMARGLVQSSIIAAYDDDSRHYHNLVHIGAMLQGLETLAPQAPDRDALILAILFHDAVYDATKADNEAASAQLARLHLSDLSVAPAMIARAEDLILSTRHGTATPPHDVAMALLIDLDLAILAAAPAHYAAYAAAIRREYAHVPEDAFRSGRKRVLEGFLARPRIFTTPPLVGLWEARARTNIAAECADLGT